MTQLYSSAVTTLDSPTFFQKGARDIQVQGRSLRTDAPVPHRHTGLSGGTKRRVMRVELRLQGRARGAITPRLASPPRFGQYPRAHHQKLYLIGIVGPVAGIVDRLCLGQEPER